MASTLWSPTTYLNCAKVNMYISWDVIYVVLLNKRRCWSYTTFGNNTLLVRPGTFQAGYAWNSFCPAMNGKVRSRSADDFCTHLWRGRIDRCNDIMVWIVAGVFLLHTQSTSTSRRTWMNLTHIWAGTYGARTCPPGVRPRLTSTKPNVT